MDQIIVDGISFIRSDRPYYYNSTNRLYLHRYIWMKHYGDIPEGYQIHHKDGDALNNSIDNLEILPGSEHTSLHMNNLSPERKKFLSANVKEKALPEAIKWHKSEEGRDWHKEHYENTKDKLHEKVKTNCSQCQKEFLSIRRETNTFCSNKCKAKYRRESGVDDEIRVCVGCSETYSANKYSKRKYCSRKCANIHKSKDSPNLRE